ncbi:MAG: flagellar protein FliS [Planctomycetota bacterium]
MTYQQQDLVENMVSGWTRVEMLIALYERAIAAVESAAASSESGELADEINFRFESRRTIFGLFTGLDTENCEIANNIGRLLTFIMACIEERKYDDAIRFLKPLHNSFTEIKNIAVKLEKQGKIPPIQSAATFEQIA